jgi:ABC-type glycerol-3-phosphate transport system substrate-binding protein
MPYFSRRSLAVAPLLVALAACSAEETDATSSEEDLTSVTAFPGTPV